MSISGLVYWAYGTLVVFAWVGVSAIFLPPTSSLLLFGYVYLLASVYFSVKTGSVRALSTAGIILNLPLVGFFIYAVSHIEDRLHPASLVPLAFVLAWFLLWISRWFVAKDISVTKQIFGLMLLLAVLGAGAITIWPLTVAPQPEAERLGLAGAQAPNSSEARRFFEQALKQANRIRNPFKKERPLQRIAYYQAKANLFDDAESTALACASDTGRTVAFNAIVRAQVENGDLNQAVRTTKSHGTGNVLFMALREAAVFEAETGQSAKANELIRFADQTANDPIFENLRRWSFAEIAIAQAQLGLHEEALISLNKTGDEYAPAHLITIAITEKEAGFFERSRASIQEAIRRVLLLRKTDNDRDHTLFEFAHSLSAARCFEEAKLLSNAVHSNTTREMLFRSISEAEARQPQEYRSAPSPF